MKAEDNKKKAASRFGLAEEVAGAETIPPPPMRSEPVMKKLTLSFSPKAMDLLATLESRARLQDRAVARNGLVEAGWKALAKLDDKAFAALLDEVPPQPPGPKPHKSRKQEGHR